MAFASSADLVRLSTTLKPDQSIISTRCISETCSKHAGIPELIIILKVFALLSSTRQSARFGVKKLEKLR